MEGGTEAKKPFKIKDVTRNVRKAIVASTLEEMKQKVAEKFEKIDIQPTIHLDSDGTEVDDEEYFKTLEPNSELIAVFPGEHWIDPTQFVTISKHHDKKLSNMDMTDATEEHDRIKQLVGQLKSNLCTVSVMSDPDLDSLSNMDPNSLVDIAGVDILKDATGRTMCAKREAKDRIDLLKILINEAVSSSTCNQNNLNGNNNNEQQSLSAITATTDSITPSQELVDLQNKSNLSNKTDI